MEENNLYSGETACSLPHRNKIYGHLFTKEEELEAKIEKLEKRLNDLEKSVNLNVILSILSILPAPQNCIRPYGFGDWRLQQQICCCEQQARL